MAIRFLYRRREFITLLGGAAAAWPLAARAQQPERVRRIGVLMNLASDDAEGQARLAAFHQGLQQLGWTVGRNVQIDYRWAVGDTGRFHRYAGELLALAPDVVLASATPSVQALQQATSTVPIVFANVGDPVAMGIVASLARPGGNATGFTPLDFGFAAKWLQLLKEIAPSVTRVAVLEGRLTCDIAIEYRWAEGRDDRYAAFAAEFVQRRVDVIVTAGTAATMSVKKATFLLRLETRSGPGWSPAWRARAAMSPVYRTCRPILGASDLNCCVKSYLLSIEWLSLAMPIALSSGWKWSGSRRRRSSSALMHSGSKS
jgi:ABC-type uncharacterized transport system substrate-binding protein